MKQGISYWLKTKTLKRIAWLVIIILLFNPIAFDFIPFSPFKEAVGTPVAQAAVADRDGLGVEGFWSYYSKDLGAGWKYSINTFTGNLVIQKDLIHIPGRGIGLGEGLVYNSLSAQAGVVGIGWQLTSDLFVKENADGSVTFKDGDATNHKFTKNGDGTYAAPAGVYLKLTKVDATTFTIKDQANSIYRFQSGSLVSATDEKGNATSFSYDTSSRLSAVSDPSGRVLSYSYGANGRLASITDPANRTTLFGYDASGRLTSVTDPKGGIIHFAYDGSGRLASITDANGHGTLFFYSADGRVNRIKDARSNPTKEYNTTLAYDTSLLKTTITDPAGKSVAYVHNSAGNLIETQSGAEATDYTWDNNNLVAVTDSSGQTNATYDANGNPTSIIDTLNSTTNATTTATYNSANKPTMVTDPNNNQTTAKYDSAQNMLSSSNPARKEADANTYDPYGNLTSATEPGAPTYNFLQNGSFEWTDSYGRPQFWTRGGNTSAISVDKTVAFYGNASVRIKSLSQTIAYLYSREVNVVTGQKLTLSVPIKMEGVAGAGGADAGIEYYDANWNYVGSDYTDLYLGTGTDKLMIASTAPTGATYAIAVVELWEASGTVWFDGAQLESPVNANEGHILTRFDYVENSSFEAGSTYWYAGGTTSAVSVSAESPWAGKNSAKINLSSSSTAWIGSQEIKVRPDEPLTLSGFLKTSNISGSGARIEVEYYDKYYNYLGISATKIQTGTQDYTRYAVTTTPPTNAVYAVVYGVVYSSTGVAYFDNLKLVPRSTTRYYYDSAANYVTDVIDPLGNWTDFAYDAVGNRTMVNDPKGNITNFTYDALNNLTSVKDPLGAIFRFDYDPVSLQVAYRDGRSASEADNTYKTVFSYNELNQITVITDPLGRTIRNTYDDSANLAKTVFPNGKEILFSYDSSNRLSEKSYLNEATRYTFSYDGAGNLSQVADDKSRSYSFAYDMANRLTSITDIFGYRLNFNLDKVGNVASITDSNNKTISYTYGSTNQLLTLTDTSGRQTKYYYDEAGRPFAIVKGNGLEADILYDEAGRVKEIADVGNPDGSIYNYVYDANGNIVNIYGWSGAESFAYDALNRLTSWTNEAGVTTTYSYDAVGNLTKKGDKTFTYNAANEITNPGFTYDQNGNLTSDGTYNYTYNSENQLVKVTKVSDGSTVATYEYNHDGLRVSKATAGGTTRYHWDDKDRLVRESDGNGATIALYIYDDRDQLIAIEKGGAIYYTHVNWRGDILAITDASGNRVATYKYDPWGSLISKTGTFDIPFRYAGYYFDSETGLYYLKARYYSPELSRFLTKDTFKGFDDEPQSLNLYAYCSGNPVMKVDSSGHTSVYVPWGGGKTVTATFVRNVIKLTVTWTVYTMIASGGYHAAYAIANALKKKYFDIFRVAFPVSTKSTAIEIIGHVVPDALARIIGISSANPLIRYAMSSVVRRTSVVDIGPSTVDSNRWIWDGLAKLAWWL